MREQIEAILFDMGGTLRSTAPRTDDEKRAALRRIMDLIGRQGSAEEFGSLLSERAKAYKHWAEQTQIELSESDLWIRWMLPDFPSGQIAGLALQLNELYRETMGLGVMRPESREVVLELFRRGYRLGLVSNTTSSVEVPALLKELEIAGCFEAVVLSAVLGKRKPDPAILLNATDQIGIAAEHCAYVGDKIDRDVAAARKAGFATAIILRDPHKSGTEAVEDPTLKPDHTLENLRELLDLFPPLASPRPKPATVYDVSLSTMWAIKTLPSLADFFEFARRTGFARIELNHKVTSAMLDGIDLDSFQFSSVHEPCPADISTDELKRRDWLISSTNEENRLAGVKAIQRSIDLASRLNTPVVVVHAGQVDSGTGLEQKLRRLIASGRVASDEYHEIQQQMIQARDAAAGASFESVKKSMGELLAYAETSGVRLGVENRYHYLEIPSPDELGILLSLAGPDRIGFIYDVGHAHTLDRLGFYPHEEWLRRFAPRIIGVHLHDVAGLTDHYAPGLGEVNFSMVAGYLPENAFRTCEFQTFNSPEQLSAGLKVLAEQGCIKCEKG